MIKECFEKYTNAQLTELIRSAMSEGCIKPCHVYDAVDILLDRLADKPLRNCDIGTVEDQSARFYAFCNSHWGKNGLFGSNCEHCPLTCFNCKLEWAQMPYKKGEADGDEK